MRTAVPVLLAALGLTSGCGSDSATTAPPPAQSVAPTTTPTPTPLAGKAAKKVLDDAIEATRRAATGTYLGIGSYLYPSGGKKLQATTTERGRFDLSSERYALRAIYAMDGRSSQGESVVDGADYYSRSFFELASPSEWQLIPGQGRNVDREKTAGFGTRSVPIPLFVVTQTDVRSATALAGGAATVEGVVPAPIALLAANAFQAFLDAKVDLLTLRGPVPAEIGVREDGTLASVKLTFAKVKFTAGRKPTPLQLATLRSAALHVSFDDLGEPVEIQIPKTARRG